MFAKSFICAVLLAFGGPLAEAQDRSEPRFLTFEQWHQLRPLERVAYIVRLRDMVVEMEKEVAKGAARSATGRPWMEIFLQPAWAGPSSKVRREKGDLCLAAGHVSKFVVPENGLISCAAPKSSLEVSEKLQCEQVNQIACNPLLFGQMGMRPVCVPPGRFAAQECQRTANRTATTWSILASSSSSASPDLLSDLKESFENLRRGLTKICSGSRNQNPECRVLFESFESQDFLGRPILLPAIYGLVSRS